MDFGLGSLLSDAESRMLRGRSYIYAGSLLRTQDLDKGYLGPNDTLELKVEITVQRDVHYAYDSRKETG